MRRRATTARGAKLCRRDRTTAWARTSRAKEIREEVRRARNILPSGSRSGTPTCQDQNAVMAANSTTMIRTGVSHPRPRSSAPATAESALVGFSVLADTITGPFFPAFGVAGPSLSQTRAGLESRSCPLSAGAAWRRRPAWSEGYNGTDVAPGIRPAPTTWADCARTGPWVSTRSIRVFSWGVAFDSVPFWQQVSPGSPGLTHQASLNQLAVRSAYVVVVSSVGAGSASELKSPVAITAPRRPGRTGQELTGLRLLGRAERLDLEVGVDEAELLAFEGAVHVGPASGEGHRVATRRGQHLLRDVVAGGRAGDVEGSGVAVDEDDVAVLELTKQAPSVVQPKGVENNGAGPMSAFSETAPTV